MTATANPSTALRRRARRAAAGIGGVIVLSASLVACADDAEENQEAAGGEIDLSSVALQVGDQVAGTETALRASGELEGTEYDIEFSTFSSGPPQIEAMNAGQIDVAITGNTPPILAGETSTKVVQAYSNDASSIIIAAPPGSELESLEDLEGQSVAVAQGSNAHGLLVQALHSVGLSSDDIEVNYLQPADAVNAFQSGDLSAWSIWDPYAAIAELNDAEVLFRGTGLTNGFGFAIASDEALADPGREAALEDLLERVARAYHWTVDNPDEWAEVFAEESGIDREVAEVQTRSSRLPIALNDEVVAQQNDIAEAFLTDDVVAEAVDFEDLVDRRFEESVAEYQVPLDDIVDSAPKDADDDGDEESEEPADGDATKDDEDEDEEEADDEKSSN
ncbi:ABC transporter substrate-binding protein [Corynebacterium otitidis]|uniref:Putative aliphatic sulfonates-binding protein n=1 Tax=Corynebacterium otitidis ATCC 51513 TaxID=883169 RepID=I7LBG6_9CORY|nr:ABC transporter substrate-binding protein [Corynebacterium otitidis]EJZ82908.1 aliphatic sulfonates family ABC transporter, substrate-binding protein [Corynebacterium otitidis ATCC 51513]CCI83094.1 putative aliphatic sulfonates-binding protein [Corynebacterium otitidis ATCC 51513]